MFTTPVLQHACEPSPGRKQFAEELVHSSIVPDIFNDREAVCDDSEAPEHGGRRCSEQVEGGGHVIIADREDQSQRPRIQPTGVVGEIEANEPPRGPRRRRRGSKGGRTACCDVARGVSACEVQAINKAVFGSSAVSLQRFSLLVF